ncbi:hypothetical protein GLOIN_2v1880782 [Rhizophagus clarus]|uniref:Uncharacterized protein n=1 Tax=Rhizophagus clarus TaxID=94130 RepID=A0A8H3LWR0_9GLOM|nr:hypothetical protein GLOIN_2v1880782 [Rhizophagus clarus]
MEICSVNKSIYSVFYIREIEGYFQENYCEKNSHQQLNVALPPNHNLQQQYDDSNNILPNYEQYTIQQSGNSNNNVTTSDISNNVPHHNNNQQPGNSNNSVTVIPDHNLHQNYQQTISNVISNNNFTTSLDVSNNIPHHNNQQPVISIYYSQAPIIIMPTTNSDIQNQFQQVLTSSILTINS